MKRNEGEEEDEEANSSLFIQTLSHCDTTLAHLLAGVSGVSMSAAAASAMELFGPRRAASEGRRLPLSLRLRSFWRRLDRCKPHAHPPPGLSREKAASKIGS
jgi:hypothetical protein